MGISKAVFKQSLIYLGAFYLTWPAYLALQIMLANGKGYSQYGFFLYAGTSATLQGFWNCIFHLNYEKFKKGISRAFSGALSSGSGAFGRRTTRVTEHSNKNTRFSQERSDEHRSSEPSSNNPSSNDPEKAVDAE